MDDAPSRAEFNEGLSSVEARRRLAEFGPNSLPMAKPPSMLEWLTELLASRRGSVVLAGAFGIYAMSLAGGADEDVARTMALLVAILGDLTLVLSNASQQSVFHHWRLPAPQPLFAPIAGATVALLTCPVSSSSRLLRSS